MSARVRAALDADLDAAVGAFDGSAEDRRIWASIAFQAFLNSRFPKGGAA